MGPLWSPCLWRTMLTSTLSKLFWWHPLGARIAGMHSESLRPWNYSHSHHLTTKTGVGGVGELLVYNSMLRAVLVAEEMSRRWVSPLSTKTLDLGPCYSLGLRHPTLAPSWMLSAEPHPLSTPPGCHFSSRLWNRNTKAPFIPKQMLLFDPTTQMAC